MDLPAARGHRDAAVFTRRGIEQPTAAQEALKKTMEILFVLVPLALLLSGIGLVLFFKAVGSGQFEDLDGDGARLLLDPPPVYVDDSEPKL